MDRLRRVPQRMCVACRTKRPKRELVRIVRSPDNLVLMDPTGKRPGRGAYICPTQECLNRAIKSKSLERILKSPIEVEVFVQLEEELKCQQPGLI